MDNESDKKDSSKKSNVISFPGGAKPVAAGDMKQTSVSAVQSLKENLKALNDLHSRLRFMLTELEDLVKR